MRRIGTLGIDWDGVIHESPEWRPVMGQCNFDLIREAHKRGYAVAIVTAGEIPAQADCLEAAGFDVVADEQCRRGHWHGGRDGRTVLLTHRKISSAAYIDDRAIRYQYGEPIANVFSELDARQAVANGTLTRSGRGAA